MSLTMSHFKLVTGDLAAAERFYAAIGLDCVGRNIGGENEFRHAQCRMSAPGAPGLTLILSHFPNCPPPARISYPGEAWLVFTVDDVDETAAKVVASGGAIIHPAEDFPEHSARAAITVDPEGHPIELVGPMRGASNKPEVALSQSAHKASGSTRADRPRLAATTRQPYPP
jgi:predicted enzyme related to lactoylglutathione lyase